MMMKKLAYVLTAVSLLGAVTPASAQYFVAGGGAVAVGVGPAPYYGYSSWWGGAGYAYAGSWWGGAGYAYAADPGYAYVDPGYSYYAGSRSGVGSYASDWWGGGGAAYAYVPSYSCRIVTTRHQLPDGRIIVRRARTC